MKKIFILAGVVCFCFLGACLDGGGGSGDVPPGDIVVEELSQAESVNSSQAYDVLYAAHAGIGYMSVDPGDEVFLYDVMVDDPGQLATVLMGRTFLSESQDETTRQAWLIKVGQLGLGMAGIEQTVKFEHSEEGLESSLYVTASKVEGLEDGWSGIRFAFVLSAGFSGFSLEGGAALYSGSGQDDFWAQAGIDILSYNDDSGSQGTKIVPGEISITARNTLNAQYGTGENVSYGGWNIYYGLEGADLAGVNVHVFPAIDAIRSVLKKSGQEELLGMIDDIPDHRLYTIKGSFFVNDDLHIYPGMRYAQYHLNEGENVNERIIAMRGDVSPASLGWYCVRISSGLDELLDGNFGGDPASWVNVILRGEDGIWKTGILNLWWNSDQNNGMISFADGNASFSESLGGGVLHAWQCE